MQDLLVASAVPSRSLHYRSRMALHGWCLSRVPCRSKAHVFADGVVPPGEFLCWGAFTTPNGQQSHQIGGHREYTKIAE